MKYTKNDVSLDGLDNLNYCLECSFKEVGEKGKFSLKNPEVVNEIKEAISYKEELFKN